MTWGFVTCGPNEALVVSGRLKILSEKQYRWNSFGFKDGCQYY